MILGVIGVIASRGMVYDCMRVIVLNFCSCVGGNNDDAVYSLKPLNFPLRISRIG